MNPNPFSSIPEIQHVLCKQLQVTSSQKDLGTTHTKGNKYSASMNSPCTITLNRREVCCPQGGLGIWEDFPVLSFPIFFFLTISLRKLVQFHHYYYSKWKILRSQTHIFKCLPGTESNSTSNIASSSLDLFSYHIFQETEHEDSNFWYLLTCHS